MNAEPKLDADLAERRLLADHADAFRARFGAGHEPRRFFSPGRVNLMGAHLDYNGGPVMPTAIDRGTFIAVRPRADRVVRMASTLESEAFESSLDDLPRSARGSWWDYPVGVVLQLANLADERGAVRALSGFDVLFGGNLKIGAGLSSSASICVGSAHAFNEIWELELPTLELVGAALGAERGHVGVQCGIMDPYAVGLSRPGTLLWLDCKDASWEHLPLSDDLIVAVADTGVRRKLAQSEFNQRVRECAEAFARLRRAHPAAECLRDVPLEVLDETERELTPKQARRARHVLDEVARTFQAKEALSAGRVDVFGAQMTLAHQSLRELFEVSCPELDRLVEDAVAVPGVMGSRLTGAGFGGCAVVLARREAEAELGAALERGFRAAFGRAPLVERFATDRGPREVE